MALSQKAPQNGWAFVFISNESDEAVLFDDLLVTQEHGRISEENHYYPFGLKIAGISSRAVNKQENKYGYQGDFAEHDDETGWDDFYLRSYDAQIGRFVQFDPYDQFVSGYVGMGNDPINNFDPSGGYSFGPMSTPLLNHAFWTVGGAVIGGILDGGNGRNGALIGGGTGLGVSFVNWGAIASAVGNAAQSVSEWLRSEPKWLNLTKSVLITLVQQYSGQLFTNSGALQNYAGNIFERNFHAWMSQTNSWPVVEGISSLNAYQPNSTPDEMDDGNSSIPGHSSRAYVIVDGKATVYQSEIGVKNSIVAHPNAAWFEIKATDRVVSKSSNNYQIQYEMEALAYFHPRAAKAKVAQYHVVTTAGGAVGNGVYEFGVDS